MTNHYGFSRSEQVVTEEIDKFSVLEPRQIRGTTGSIFSYRTCSDGITTEDQLRTSTFGVWTDWIAAIMARALKFN